MLELQARAARSARRVKHDHEVVVVMTITATVPADYNTHEVADAVRFYVGLSELDCIEADISAISITEAKETLMPADRDPATIERWLAR